MAKIKILYEDDSLIAAFKQSGVPVHQTLDKTRAHFQGMLEKQLGQKLVLFHRLDADTSGVVLFGKNPEINKAVTDMFRERKIHKVYDAVVDGIWPEDLLEIRGYIKESLQKKGRYELFEKGKANEFSKTLFAVVKNNEKLKRTHVEVSTETGRTHQIRVHCASAGYPICGDKFYGSASKQGVPLALHARSLEFDHPITQKTIHIRAELPESIIYWIG